MGEYFGGIIHNNMALRLGPRITILDLNGEVLQRLGDKPMGDEPGRFYTPHGIATDSKGNLYVAEVSWTLPGMTMKPPRELRSMQKLVKIPTGDTNG